VGVGIRNGNDTRLPGTGRCASHGRPNKGFDARTTGDSGKPHFDKRRTSCGKLARRAFDDVLVDSVSQCGGDGSGRRNDMVDFTQDAERYGSEGTLRWILGVDEIGATCQRSRCFRWVRDAHQELHFAITI
jgi:hypothetical protein